MDGECARLVVASPVDVVFCLDDVFAFGHVVEVIVGGKVFGRTICTVAIARQLFDGFHASSTSVGHLYKVQVALCVDSDAYRDAVTYL